jgi:DnaJ-class molecular chaperone
VSSLQRDYYKVLQVDAEAQAEVITAAYRALARRLHPDRDLTGVHEVRMSELNRAYGVLRDPASRQAYDAERAQRLSPVGPGSMPPAEESDPRVTPAASVDGTPDGGSMVGGLTRRMEAGAPATGRRSTPVKEQVPVNTQLDFGRYAGRSLRELVQIDTDYLRWLARHSSGIRFRGEISRLLGERLDDPYADRSSS